MSATASSMCALEGGTRRNPERWGPARCGAEGLAQNFAPVFPSPAQKCRSTLASLVVDFLVVFFEAPEPSKTNDWFIFGHIVRALALVSRRGVTERRKGGPGTGGATEGFFQTWKKVPGNGCFSTLANFAFAPASQKTLLLTKKIPPSPTLLPRKILLGKTLPTTLPHTHLQPPFLHEPTPTGVWFRDLSGSNRDLSGSKFQGFSGLSRCWSGAPPSGGINL